MDTKVCSKCGVLRSFTEYCKGDGKHGLKSRCKPCCAAYLRQLRQLKPEKFQAYDAKKYIDHRDKILSRNRERQRTNYWADPSAARARGRDSRKKYYRPDRQLLQNQKAVGELSAGYLASKLGMSLSRLPTELIEAKRVHLQIHRLLRDMTK